MTLQEIREKKSELNDNIMVMCQNFEQETNLRINCIGIDRTPILNHQGFSYITHITTDIRI